MNYIKTYLCLVFAAAGYSAASASPDPGSSDLWYVTTIAGKPVGYLHQSSAPRSDGGWSSLVESRVTLNRLGSRVVIDSSATYGEDVDGHLRTVRSALSMSHQVTRIQAKVGAGSIALTTSTGGRTYNRSVPTPETLLGTIGTARLLAANLKSPGDKLVYSTFDGTSGSVERCTCLVAGSAAIDLLGRKATALTVKQTNDLVPGEAESEILGDGTIYRLVADTPFGKLVSERCAPKVALAAASGSTLPDESYARTLLTANVRLPHERNLDEVTIELTQRHPGNGWPELDFANQKVLSKSRDRMVVRITRPSSTGAFAAAHGNLEPFLDPNPVLQSDDPEVVRISHELTSHQEPPLAEASKLQEWTHRHMSLDLGVALAPASEVVRDRHGTCVAYSVLLSSLMRSAGVPSRVMMGYAYVEGIWGGHAWTEMWDGSRWVPFDAALYRRGPSDAARVAFIASALSDGLPMGPLSQMFGNVDIRTLGYTYHGHRVAIPKDAKPYKVSGSTYENPWLGVTVQGIPGFRFDRLDQGWPDNTLLNMRNGNRSVELHLMEGGKGDAVECLEELGTKGRSTLVKSHGKVWCVVTGHGVAGAALEDDDQVWAIKASGPHAERLLRAALDRIRV